MDIKTLNEELGKYVSVNETIVELKSLIGEWLKSLQFHKDENTNTYKRVTEDKLLEVKVDCERSDNKISITLYASGNEVFTKIVNTVYETIDIIKDLKDIIIGKKVA